jgi:hypothetical protein
LLRCAYRAASVIVGMKDRSPHFVNRFTWVDLTA